MKTGTEAVISAAVVGALGVGLLSHTRRRAVLTIGATAVIAARAIYVGADYILWLQSRATAFLGPGPTLAASEVAGVSRSPGSD